MSIEAMTVVLHHSTLSGTAKLVLLGIANHEGDGGAFPAIATLARYANTSERTVQRAIAEAVAAGELHVEEQAGGTSKTRTDRRPNLYRILVTCPVVCDRSTNHKMSQNGVTPVSPRGLNGVTSVTERGDIRDANGVTPVSPEPYIEPFLGEPSTSGDSVAVVSEPERLANLLADLIAGNGSKRPTVTPTWVNDIRLMIERDEREPARIEAAIRWCQADPFWSANILSPKALRKQYDRMRLQARRRSQGRDSQQAAVADEAALTGRPVEEVRAQRMADIAATAALARRKT